MLIRKLTLAAFAIFATATSSLALIGNAAQHAAPALADQRDHGHNQQRDNRRGDNRRSSYDGRQGNRGYGNRGYGNRSQDNRGRDHGHTN
jgi:hypothetical protein